MVCDVLDTRQTRHHKDGGSAKKVEVAGWGLFFIWVGIALLTDIGWGVGLIGVAAIILGGQVARKLSGLAVEGFWLVCGVLFLVGGLWETWQVHISLVPILFLVAGAALLASLVFKPRRRAG